MTTAVRFIRLILTRSYAMHRNVLRRILTLVVGLTLLPTAEATLVAHWTFDEASGTLTAFDSSGNGLHGALAGGADFVSGGVSGNAIDLTATDAWVNMGDVLGSTFTGGSFTISLWVKTATNLADTIVVSKHQGGSLNGNFIGLNTSAGYGQAGRAYFYTGENPGGEVTSASVVTDDNWRQIVTVYNAGAGNSKSIFVDGAPAEASGAAANIGANNADFLIGGVWFAGTGPTDRYFGLVDDVQIYNAALTDNQIDFLYTNPGLVVPLPAAVWLLISGLAGLIGFRRYMS